MIGLSGKIPLVSHSDVTSPFPPSGNGGYASNRDDLIKEKPKFVVTQLLISENIKSHIIADIL